MMPSGLLFGFALFVARLLTLVLRLPFRSNFSFFPFRVLPIPRFPFISFRFLGLDGEEAVETSLLFCAEEFLQLLCTFSDTFFTVAKRYIKK